MRDTSINDLLREKVAGVWSGTYRVIRPTGEVLEEFPSRQEGRMEGNTWTEKVTYFRDGEEPYVHYYHATVDGDSVKFHNSNMWGVTTRVGDEAVAFLFGWDERPQERILEVTRPDGNKRSRVWQHFEDGLMTKLTIIREERVAGAEAEQWDPSTNPV